MNEDVNVLTAADFFLVPLPVTLLFIPFSPLFIIYVHPNITKSCKGTLSVTRELRGSTLLLFFSLFY